MGVVAPSFALVPDLLRHSDLVALLPRLSAAEAEGLAVFEPPVAVPDFALRMARLRRRFDEVTLGFVAGEVREMMAGLGRAVLG